jgi:BirA family biotin operon repressor/biotin-[acetyl-CoA-carboxylase] ligase
MNEFKVFAGSSHQDFVQKICDKLGVSRTAIWKHINNLKKDGYNIKSTSNKGYKLVTDEKTINEHEIKKYLEVDVDIFYVEETISTNLIAKEKAFSMKKAMGVVVASKQNSGKGRMGRSFSSNNDDGLWNTFVFKPDIPPEMATFFKCSKQTIANKISAILKKLKGE